METISSSRSFGGVQGVYAHDSSACACHMRFGVYTPPGEGPFPALFWLSGLTCTEENFITKAGAQRAAAEHGLVIIAPDTSPRGEGVPDDPDGAYDFGLGAGFYVDATEPPFDTHYHMQSYIVRELPALIAEHFPVTPERMGVFGHSMGGHGALTLHLKNPDLFRTCSAFAPIVAPSKVPWGKKALSGYLGLDEEAWAAYDATQLVAVRPSAAEILIDQGLADPFLKEQLRPELFEEAARAVGQKATVRRHEGYDHSYYFMASFIDEHIKWHKDRL